MMKKSYLLVVLLAFLGSFKAYSVTIAPGPWRFEVRTVHARIPFILRIEKKRNDYSAILENGKEKIKLKRIVIKKDLITIPLGTYETALELNPAKDGSMSGFLIRYNKNPQVRIPVVAVYGETERFLEEKSKPTIDLNGKWAVTLTESDDKESSGVMLFEQDKNKLNGTIMTPTGDYRYMEGFVSGNEFEAASFDGGYNYLLKGRVKDGKLEAKILSNSKTAIEGIKNDKIELPDAYKQTQVESIQFSFPNASGKMISLADASFKNKPVIIQFFGSWCPNCLDESNYLGPWYEKNKRRGIEIVGLAFERSLTPGDAKIQLLKTQKKLKISYPILIAGSTSEDKPIDKVPGLKNFISFPTTVFLNKKHEVVKVHAGFNGPSTGEYFEKWKNDFNQTVDELLK